MMTRSAMYTAARRAAPGAASSHLSPRLGSRADDEEAGKDDGDARRLPGVEEGVEVDPGQRRNRRHNQRPREDQQVSHGQVPGQTRPVSPVSRETGAADE